MTANATTYIFVDKTASRYEVFYVQFSIHCICGYLAAWRKDHDASAVTGLYLSEGE